MRNAQKKDEVYSPALPDDIPQKLYYKIGEVCEITNIPSHVLRFWEKQFPQLSPNKTQSGHRLYKKRDILVILQIRDLLYERKFTIKGAREYLATGLSSREVTPDTGARLGKLKEGLLRIKSILDRPAPFDS
jgi:DNA-binding transcriptional MerR regulator